MAGVNLPSWLPAPSVHFLVVALALLFYLISTHARRERRAPAAAIAWVLGLMLLPYLVLPLYLLFGWRKVGAPAARPTAQPAAPSHWAPALLASFGLAAPAPAQVRFHADGAAARDGLWQLIDRARQRLDVCTFLIGDDAFGRETLARLADRARAGVQVRLLHDGLGAWSAPSDAMRTLAQAGAAVAVFHPLLSLRRGGPRNLRNHRKLAIADGTHLWAGGRNLAAEYFTGDDTKPPWLDLSFDLTGAVATHAADQFARDWAAAGAVDLHARRTLPPAPTGPGGLAQFLPSGPDQAEDTARALLIAAAFQAQDRLLAVTPYFVPDAALHYALRLAARRGVRVTLVMPAVSNHRLADFVRGRPLRELANAGADIRLLPQMSHAKAVVVDDTLALCGSINLDARSLLLNYESAVVFYGKAEIDWLATWIDTQAANAAPYEARPPGLLRDLAEGGLLAVAFQL